MRSLKFIIAFLLASLCVSAVFRISGAPFLTVGPEYEVAESAAHLWKTGSVESPAYRRLFVKLLLLSREHPHTRYWQDAFSLTSDNRLIPEHCLLQVFLAAPFFGLFGRAGFWLFNQLALLLLALSARSIVHRLIRQSGPPKGLSAERLDLLLLLLITLGTQTALYSYNFSYDLLAAVLVIGGLALIPSSPLFGAFTAAMSVFVRPSNVLYLPFVLLAWRRSKQGWMLDLAIGALTGVGLYCAFNWQLFGHPLLTSHDRLVSFLDGKLLYAHSPFAFSRAARLAPETVFDDLFGKIFSLEMGVLPANLVLLLLPAALFALWKGVNARFHSLCLGAAFVQVLVIFSYPVWHANGVGSRYLFPAVFLILFPVLEGLVRATRNGKIAKIEGL